MDKKQETELNIINLYFNDLDSCKFLTKKEEQEIGTRIKVTEQKMIRECINYKAFRNSLENLSKNMSANPDNIVKCSKELIDEPTDEDRERVSKLFGKMADSLHHRELEEVLFYLKEINITSSALNNLLAPIKKNFVKINELEEKTKNTYKFLEVESGDEYDQLVINCKDSNFRKILAKKLYTDESNLIKRLNSQEDVIKQLKKDGLDQTTILDIKILIKTVSNLEEQYKEDRERLIKGNLPLVVSIAKRFSRYGMDLEDLIQEGNIGLIKAVDKYEPTRNVKITTYATWWINQAIRRAISNKSKLVRIPIHIQHNLKIINQTFFVWSQKLKREPTLKEISEETEIPLNVIEDLNRSALHEVGIDSELSSGLSYEDVLHDKNSETTFRKVSKSLLKEAMRVALSSLTPRHQKIIMLRFGIGTYKKHTLEEIGQKFSVTRERIRQIEKKVIEKLKENSDARRLNDES